MNYVTLSIVTGPLLAIGVLLIKEAIKVGGISVTTSLLIFGLVYTVSMISQRPQLEPVPVWVLLFVVGSALCFCAGSATQFTAFARAPMAVYAMLISMALNVATVAAFEVAREVLNGSFRVGLQYWHRPVAAILALAAISLFMLAPRDPPA